MKTIAIVGAGPTGLYTFFSLLKAGAPLSISIYEKAEKAGVGMPYNADDNSGMMLANIASIEIPPIASTYLDWLRSQDESYLARYGVDRSTLHDRQFLPRILLGAYFRDQFLTLVDAARARGFSVTVHESCKVTDIAPTPGGVKLRTADGPVPMLFDRVVIATGHVWPGGDEATSSYFPSPWSGLIEAEIPACRVGIMGTSLSAIDAAMAVVARHGAFVENGDGKLRFHPHRGSEALSLTLMSRTGVLPEADFYCPIPYEPLQIATPSAIAREIAAGSSGLLDRFFALAVRELELADPAWSERVALATHDADSFAHVCFAARRRRDPFRWAQYNLKEVERNKRRRHTVPWRYAILRLHEAAQQIVPHLDDEDRARFDVGLRKVFIDNYAAVPSESIRRLLALRQAGVIDVLTLGPEYRMDIEDDRAVINFRAGSRAFDVVVDARGQKPLRTGDLPFPSLRRQLLSVGQRISHVGSDCTLMAPRIARGRIALAALPYLMQDRPFIQGIAASADIGEAIADGLNGQAKSLGKSFRALISKHTVDITKSKPEDYGGGDTYA